jgi:5'-3' exonuclease
MGIRAIACNSFRSFSDRVFFLSMALAWFWARTSARFSRAPIPIFFSFWMLWRKAAGDRRAPHQPALFPRCAHCRIVDDVLVHLIDGTFELFRYFLSPAAAFDRTTPEELRAVRGVVGSVLGMLESGATHLGVATDHVIESFRNALWPDYKTGEGLDPLLHAQFQPLEEALSALGVVVWPMVEFEADDALAAAAVMTSGDGRVDQVVICTPDKDLAQCVRGERIVQLDRRTRELRDEAGVQKKFGVPPTSIPDWLALVGDSADGYPGLPGWGAVSAATVLARYRHLEHIPKLALEWEVSVRGALRLATTLAEQRERALLFRELATLRTDAPIGTDVDGLRWMGPRTDFAAWAERLGAPALQERAGRIRRA